MADWVAPKMLTIMPNFNYRWCDSRFTEPRVSQDHLSAF